MLLSWHFVWLECGSSRTLRSSYPVDRGSAMRYRFEKASASVAHSSTPLGGVNDRK